MPGPSRDDDELAGTDYARDVVCSLQDRELRLTAEDVKQLISGRVLLPGWAPDEGPDSAHAIVEVELPDRTGRLLGRIR